DVGLEPGDDDEEEDAEPRDDREQVGLVLDRREDVLLDLGRERAEDRGAEDDAGRELADHGGLLDLAQQLAEEAGGGEQQRELEQEDDDGVVLERLEDGGSR